MSFEVCLPVILQNEGGFSDNPHDPGGVTNLGVTIASWSSWIGRPATIAEMRMLTPEQVAPLYERNYYNASHANDCPSGVDLMVFDDAVNTGPMRAIRRLQEAVGVSADGIVGPATLAAIRGCNPSAVIDKLADLRDDYYRQLPQFDTFGHGWLARVERTCQRAHLMAES